VEHCQRLLFGRFRRKPCRRGWCAVRASASFLYEDAKCGNCVSGRLCKPQLCKICVRYEMCGRMSIDLLTTVIYNDCDDTR
jgi:hypothetical protein